MVHICHIISGDLWAGAEVMAFELIKELKKDISLSITAIVLNEGTLSANLRGIGVETYVLPEKKMSFFQTLLLIRTIIKTKKINAIHSHRFKENFLAYFAKFPSSSIRLISTQHGMPEQTTSLQSRILHGLNYFLLSHCFTTTVAVSKELRDIFIKKIRFEESKVAIIHNGISIPPQKDCGNSFTFIIGSAGRLVPVKNYSFFIEIARKLKNESLIKFKLAGDGPQRSILEKSINSYGLNSTFSLLGSIDNMSEFYSDMNVFINTSIHEGIPMTILEAMSYGIPAIGPKVGGIPEIIDDGIDGYLARVNDVESYTEKCLILMRNPLLYQKLSFNARNKIVNCFSIKKCSQQYSNLYRESN